MILTDRQGLNLIGSQNFLIGTTPILLEMVPTAGLVPVMVSIKSSENTSNAARGALS